MKRIHILPQPNDVTCGPTCLHALYQYFADDIALAQVISEVRYLPEGGTLAVNLGIHALSRGYQATLNVINPEVFDPSWFIKDTDIVDKLRQQLLHKHHPKLQAASESFIEFIHQGGKLTSHDITAAFLRRTFEKNIPILTGLSATYLYRCRREITVGYTSYYDDVKGIPCGHFVVLNGYDKKNIIVADPYAKNPMSDGHYYLVKVSRLLNAILLGALTYDTNILTIEKSPPKRSMSHLEIHEGAHA